MSKYSLLKLQFKDYLFRETFIYQVMIFLDSLLNPIKDQINTFKVEAVEVQYLKVMQVRALKLLPEGGKAKVHSQEFKVGEQASHQTTGGQASGAAPHH